MQGLRRELDSMKREALKTQQRYPAEFYNLGKDAAYEYAFSSFSISLVHELYFGQA